MSASGIVIPPNHEEETTQETTHPAMSVTQTATPAKAWGAAVSPWGKSPPPTSCSLNDVMSEQLAQELDTEDQIQQTKRILGEENLSADFLLRDEPDTADDMLIAQMMQHEFDKEHDHEIKLKESKFNADSKVRITYDNYRAVHPSQWDEDEEEEEVMERQEVKEQQRNFRGRGISGKGKDIVTKHDAGISQRRNASKAMEHFPPEINVGDGLDMRLSNKVYNKLKNYSKQEAKRAHRINEKKDHSTAEMSMDPKTRLILYKMVNNGLLEDVNGVISTGKESVVFHADAGSEINSLPELPRGQPVPEIAIKVFKTTLADFKNRSEYVKGDVRFFKDEFKKQNPRKIMRLWADKESINLRRMARFGIPCPKMMMLRKHVLLMSFIGDDRKAAPKLKDAHLSQAEAEMAYAQVVQNMKTMYRDCLLVHGDLSEYNLLWHRDTVYFIDVSQAVDRTHPHAHEFLLRDCRNVCQYFSRLGVHDVMDKYALFNSITGLNLNGTGKEFLMQIQDYERNENMLRLGASKKDYNFDFFFERESKNRQQANTDQESAKVDTKNNTDQGLENAINPAYRDDQALANERADELSSSDDEDSEQEKELLFEKYIEERRAKLVEETLGDENVEGKIAGETSKASNLQENSDSKS